MSAQDESLNIERHMARTEAQLELLSIRFKDLESQIDKADGLTDEIKIELAILKDQISHLNDGLQDIKIKTEKLTSNVFLQFTSDMTSQKLITIILILSTAISSPTLITSWLNGSLPDGEVDRIEKLIDLLQENVQNN